MIIRIVLSVSEHHSKNVYIKLNHGDKIKMRARGDHLRHLA